MCGRIVQARSIEEYFQAIGWAAPDVVEIIGPRADGLNVPPGTKPAVIRMSEKGVPIVQHIYWGYAPPGWKKQPVSNARLDKILADSPFWRRLFERGRVIVPVDGWYEWTGEKGQRVPWFVKPKDGKPLLMAAVSAWYPGAALDAPHGMAVVSDDAAGGMVDIHDRRPVCLTREQAEEWLNPGTTLERAKELAASGRPESAFVWYRVTERMNDSRYQDPDSIEPI
jgi:putative SOS response-associated peptidase YedK